MIENCVNKNVFEKTVEGFALKEWILNSLKTILIALMVVTNDAPLKCPKHTLKLVLNGDQVLWN